MQLIAKNGEAHRDVNREAVLTEIERQGEDAIRLQLAQKGLSDEKTALAREWLRHKEAERAREEAFRLEQARIAERTAAAAERQVISTERANRIALVALVFVGASFVLSLGALFKRRR